jgi:hypothetical protein
MGSSMSCTFTVKYGTRWRAYFLKWQTTLDIPQIASVPRDSSTGLADWLTYLADPVARAGRPERRAPLLPNIPRSITGRALCTADCARRIFFVYL